MEKLTNEKIREMMLEAPPVKVVPRLALPTIIAMIVDSVYNMADTYFVSSLGEAATAAVAVNDSFMNILLSIGAAFAFGAGSYVARLLGAKEDNHASRVASTTIVTSLSVAIISIFILWPLRKTLVILFGSTIESASYAIDYATWIIFAFPFTASTGFFNQMHKSEGNTSYAMLGTVSGCIINCFLDPLFINVFGLEVAGAAMATMISKIISAAILAIPFFRKKTIISISFKNVHFDSQDAKEVAKIGVAVFLRMSLLSFSGIITNNAARNYGTSALAAISIATKVYKFVSAIITGFSQGFSPIVGYCYGAKRYKRVKELYYATCKIGFTFGIIISLILWFGSATLINIFNQSLNPDVTEIGVFKIRALCLGYIPHIFTLITINMFQALGKPIGNTLLGLSRQILFFIPLLLILPKFYGIYGIASAQGIADILAGFIVALPASIILVKGINKLEKE